MQPVPGDMSQTVASCEWFRSRSSTKRSPNASQANQPLPDEVKYLAGLQRVQYVFVDPETKDVILAGPAEGWQDQ